MTRHVALVLLLLGAPSVVAAQSLGELAEKEKAKKKDPKAKTFTNDDLDKHHEDKPEPEAEPSPQPSGTPAPKTPYGRRTGRPVPRTEGRSGPESGSAEAVEKAKENGGSEAGMAGTSTSSPNASEATWRDRAKQLREGLAASEKAINAKQTELQNLALDTQPNPDDLFDPNRMQKRAVRQGVLREEIEREQARLVQLKQDLEKLEEDARQKNIPRNWLEE